MPRSVLLGIDLGTTVLKAAAFDAKTGALLADASRRIRVRAESDGAREQSISDVHRALKSVVASLKRSLGEDYSRIQGIGMASQGGSTIIADRQTGLAHTSMTLWNDARARAFLPEIASMKPASYWRTLAWNDTPGMGLARFFMLKRDRPELLQPGNISIGAGEYLYFQLTGEWRQDAGNALQIGCYNVSNRSLDPEPLLPLGLDLSFVAPMREGNETHPLSKNGAKLLGLAPGIPVAGPYMDHEAGFLSSVGISPKPLQCSLGTAWVGNFSLPKNASWESPTQLVLPSPLDSGWLVVQPLMTGNVTWDWALESFLSKNHKKALSLLNEVFAIEKIPPDGLIALPWFGQKNPFDGDSLGSGCFLGMNTHTTSSDLLRAVAAGMSYELARIFQDAVSTGCVDSVVLGGGASKGVFFQKIIASLFAPIPVYAVVEADLTGPRGVLYVFSRKTAEAKTRRVSPPPDKEHKKILKGFGLYREAFERVYGDAVG